MDYSGLREKFKAEPTWSDEHERVSLAVPLVGGEDFCVSCRSNATPAAVAPTLKTSLIAMLTRVAELTADPP